MAQQPGHLIPVAAAVTLDGLFRERVKRTPDLVAYRAHNEQHNNWRDYTWAQINHQVARWQAALERDGLKPGDRVAVMLRNSPEWVTYDQAALGLGAVVVPLCERKYSHSSTRVPSGRLQYPTWPAASDTISTSPPCETQDSDAGLASPTEVVPDGSSSSSPHPAQTTIVTTPIVSGAQIRARRRYLACTITRHSLRRHRDRTTIYVVLVG